MTASWQKVGGVLRRGGIRGSSPDGGAFWEDFRARAAMVQQDRPERATIATAPFGLALAAACGVMLAVAAGIFLTRGGDAGGMSSMKSLAVTAPHGAVLMMNDEETKSTIVLIFDMESESEEEEKA